MPNKFGQKLKLLREEQNKLQREIAPLLNIDTPLYSKIERGERITKKENVVKLAQIFNIDADELLALWLADQVSKVAGDDKVALKAIQIAEMEIITKTKAKKE